MLVIQERLLWRLCLALAASYKESRLRRILDDIGDWCNRQIDTSAVLRVLCRRAWWLAPGRRACFAACSWRW